MPGQTRDVVPRGFVLLCAKKICTCGGGRYNHERGSKTNAVRKRARVENKRGSKLRDLRSTVILHAGRGAPPRAAPFAATGFSEQQGLSWPTRGTPPGGKRC